jgi:hypothetical protein
MFGKHKHRLRQAQPVHHSASGLDRRERERLGAGRVLARARNDDPRGNSSGRIDDLARRRGDARPYLDQGLSDLPAPPIPSASVVRSPYGTSSVSKRSSSVRAATVGIRPTVSIVCWRVQTLPAHCKISDMVTRNVKIVRQQDPMHIRVRFLQRYVHMNTSMSEFRQKL